MRQLTSASRHLTHETVTTLRSRAFALRRRRYGRPSMSVAIENVALPGLGPPPPAPVARSRDPEGALHEVFGFESFRPGQREAVEAAVDGRDVLVVMPTGSGKSLCYQLPALMRDDLTLVVSPLVALMQDQVDALRARGVGDAV